VSLERKGGACWFVGTLIVALAGCAPFRELPDVSPKRQARKQTASARFGAKRDTISLVDAHSRYRQGDASGAVEILQRLVAANRDHLEARLLLAEVLLTDNRASEALPVLEPAAAAHPENPGVQHMMGLVLDANGHPGEALAYYRRAVELEPDDEVYAASYQAVLAPEPAAPETVGPRAAALPSPERLGAASEPGFVTIESGNDDPADRAVLEAVSGDPATDLLDRGMTAMSQGEPALALAFWQEAAAMKPYDPQIPISGALLALRHNQPDVAVALLGPAADAFPNSLPVRRILGTAHYRLGDYRSSQAALGQALSLDKSDALSYFLMGCTLTRLGESAAAEAHFRQAAALDPTYAPRR